MRTNISYFFITMIASLMFVGCSITQTAIMYRANNEFQSPDVDPLSVSWEKLNEHKKYIESFYEPPLTTDLGRYDYIKGWIAYAFAVHRLNRRMKTWGDPKSGYKHPPLEFEQIILADIDNAKIFITKAIASCDIKDTNYPYAWYPCFKYTPKHAPEVLKKVLSLHKRYYAMQKSCWSLYLQKEQCKKKPTMNCDKIRKNRWIYCK